VLYHQWLYDKKGIWSLKTMPFIPKNKRMAKTTGGLAENDRKRGGSSGCCCLLAVNCCCRELLPRLPTDGIFAVDGYVRKGVVQCRGESVSWQWKDDRGHWRPYSLVDSRIIEVVHSCLSFNGH